MGRQLILTRRAQSQIEEMYERIMRLSGSQEVAYGFVNRLFERLTIERAGRPGEAASSPMTMTMTMTIPMPISTPVSFACLALLLLAFLPAPAAEQARAQAAVPQPAPPAPAVAAPAPVEDPAVTAMALKIYAQMRAGKVDQTLLTPEMNAAATPEILAQTKPMFDTLGDPKRLKLESIEKLAKGTSYLYLAIFPSAQFHISLFVTQDGKVGGYRLKP